MKKLAVLTLALGLGMQWMGGSSAMAAKHCWWNCPKPTAADTWEKIRGDWNVSIQQTAGSQAFGPYGYFNACVSGDQFRSLKPSKVCVETRWMHTGGGQESDGENSQLCVKYAQQYIYLPIHSTQQVCAESKYTHVGGGQESGETIVNCLRYKTVEINLPTSPLFSVVNYSSTGGGREGTGDTMTNVLFKKAYEIPVCN